MDPVLLQRLWPVFVEEAREHLQEIGAGVLALEKGGAPDGTLNAVRRTAHGLKGSAASLGLHDIEKLAHAMETALVGKTERDRLEAARVEALLAAVEAGEEALRRGDAGQAPSVEALGSLLAALTGAESPPPPKPVEEPTALAQVWPIFRSEATEHVVRLKQAVAAARGTGSWPPGEAAALAQIATSLQGSASVLGIPEMERCARRLGEVLGSAGERPGPKRLDAVAAVAAEIEAALGPEPGEGPTPPAPPVGASAGPDASLLGIFRAEAEEVLGALEEAITRLCSPSAGPERALLVSEATRRAHNLKGSAGAVGAQSVADAAGRLQAVIGRMAEPGLESSRAAAAAADELVSMREALSAFGQAPAAAPASEPAPVEREAAQPEPAAEKASEPSVAAIGPATDRTIRVSVHTLESLARQVESFTLLRAREERRARDLGSQAAAAQEIRQLCERALDELRHADEQGPVSVLDEALGRLRQQERTLARMGQEHAREAEQIRLVSTVVREDLRDLRMVPASTALEPLRRTVREVAGRVKKQVDFEVQGGEVRLDRRILEELRDPLQHLVRNAIDHGLETPEARRAAGKRPAGSLKVLVERRGHRIAVMVADDGAGMSAERVRQAAIRRGLLSPQAAAQLSDDEALRLVFRAGFSTAEQVTQISGRGVGLDVVQAAAHKLRGTADLATEPGKGTRFTLDLPLTLAATLAVVVRSGSDYAALSYEAVERILRLTVKDLGTVAGRASVEVEGDQVPFASLAQVVGQDAGRLPLDSDRPQPAILLNAGGSKIVFAVDEVAGQHEVVVQSLGKHLARTAHLAGAAVLDDGRVVSVLNVSELVRLARPMARGAASESQRPRILIVDDSLTTRSAMKAVLEIAGYQVLPAGDGEEALALLRQTPCQLLVTDVQMPRMDGFTLTRRVKADPTLSTTPVIVVTSLDAPSDRAAGLEAGADGYLVKKDVERGKLLELVRQLLPARA